MLTVDDAGLSRYPFRTVPPVGPTSFWVGREHFRQDLTRVVASWRTREDSSLHLLWADFGAGKTHALRYVEHLATTVDPPAVAVYTDLPKATNDFKSVYEQIAPLLPEQVLSESILNFRKEYGPRWLAAPELRGDRDTPRVLWILAQMGDQPQAEVARKWIRGERLSARESASVDGVSSIKTSDHATRTLGTICQLIVKNPDYSRLVLLLDEFQRIGEAGPKKLQDVNAGIHTLYNSCPEGLSLFLSYSFGDPENISFLVTNEVRSRVNRVLNLPALDEKAAAGFIHDLLCQTSLEEEEAQRVFAPTAIGRVVAKLAGDSRAGVTPRRAMQVFGVILDSALEEEDPSIFPIDQEFALEHYQAPAADQIGLPPLK